MGSLVYMPQDQPLSHAPPKAMRRLWFVMHYLSRHDRTFDLAIGNGYTRRMPRRQLGGGSRSATARGVGLVGRSAAGRAVERIKWLAEDDLLRETER